MDSIKKKMITLSRATEEAQTRAHKFQMENEKWTEICDKHEEQLKNIQKKIQAMEGSFDCCTEQLFEVSLKLEEKEKAYTNTEGDVGGLSRRCMLMEEELEKSDIRLAKAVTELAKQSQRADGAVRKRQQLENENSSKEEENDKLENQLKNDKFTLAESERKYEDIARKLSTKEDELERGNERCTNGETKIMELEDELKKVGQNLQDLEVREEKAMKREEEFQHTILDLMNRLKNAEIREENGNMNISRLNVRIDQTEEDLVCEKIKIKDVSDALDKTFTDMLGD